MTATATGSGLGRSHPRLERSIRCPEVDVAVEGDEPQELVEVGPHVRRYMGLEALTKARLHVINGDLDEEVVTPTAITA